MAHSILEDVSEQTFTESTIKRMYSLIDRAKTDQDFQKFIYGIVNGSMRGQWKDYKRELSVVFNWFKNHIDYRRDPYGVELLQDVWATLDRQRGDCDDATIFLDAAAEVLGSPSRIVTVSTRKNKEPNHVYAEAYVGGRWHGLDATVQQSYVGWTPPQVTARRVWTRKELGISGGDEDMEGIEGLGMTDYGKGNGPEDFGTMTPVSDRLAPGVPDDISKTFADGRPGTTDQSRRMVWRAPIANNSEWTSNPRPGGGVYGPALQIAKRPTPEDLWYLVDRKYVPKVLDPDSAWWGKVPVSREDVNRMFPGSDGTMDNYLRDIASVPASAIAKVTEEVRKRVAAGKVAAKDLPAVIDKALQGYALGALPSYQNSWVGRAGIRRPYFVPAPAVPVLRPLPPPISTVSDDSIKVRSGGHMKGLGRLGDAVSDLTKSITGAVVSGAIPGDADSVNKAISAAVDAATGTTTPPPSMSSVAKTAIPLGMLALLGGAAYFMLQGGGKSTRRNPSRRRSRGGRRGKGLDMKTLLLWGGGGAAAYFLLLRPGGILAPAAKPAAATIPGMTAQQQAALNAGVQAVPGIFDSIAKLFGGGSSTPAPSSASSSGMVTSYDQLSPPAPTEPQSQFVTNFT